MTNPLIFWIIRVGLSLLLGGLALYDMCRGRVPNWVVLPLLVVAGLLTIGRLVAGELSLNLIGWVAAVWIGSFIAWRFRVFGGGDVKLVMALVGLFPEQGMLLSILISLLIGLSVGLIRRDGLSGLRRQVALLFLATQGQLPTPAEVAESYEARALRITWAISLGGIIYLWFLWRPVF